MTDLTLGAPELRASDSLSHQLAKHVAETAPSSIPPAALDSAKLFLLDTLSVAWAGSDAPGCREAHDLLASEGGRPDATAWAFGSRLPLPAAAFINGMTSAALDYDALGRDSPVHVNVTVLPTALAVAERERSSGSDFLAAAVIGSDVMCRLGASASHPHRGWSYTSALGVFGAAAAASRLLKLDATATRHALGLAFIQASGTQQANIEPSLTKRMLSAFAARGGVFAAMLAQRGITAPKEVIEGKFGLYRLYQEGDATRLLNGIGTRFDSSALSVKKYPSCGCNHTAIEAVLRLVQQNDLSSDDVISINAIVPPYVERIVGGKYDPSGDAQVAAQFNIRYSIACALVRRKLGLTEIQSAAARDPAILQHIGKISVEVDSSRTGERGPVTIKMKTRAQGEIVCRVDHVPGSTEAPLTNTEIQQKLNECFALGVRPLQSDQVRVVTEKVHSIEKVADMSKFFDGLC